MPKLILPLSLSLLCVTSGMAHSAPSADDAAKLKASIAQYLGPAADAFAITPDGDGFKAVLDVSSFTAKMKKEDGTFTLTPFELHLTPDGDGKWKVHQEGDISLKADQPGKVNLEETVHGQKFDGEWDANLAAFTQIDAKLDSVTFAETGKDDKGTATQISGEVKGITLKATGAANEDGGADLTFTETLGAAKMSEALATQTTGPVNFTVTAADGTFDGKFENFKSAAALQVAKFVVAHIGTEHLPPADQPLLKQLLGDVIPGFASMEGNGAFNTVAVQTQLGNFTLDKLAFGFTSNGIVKEGELEESFSVEGLTIPPGIAPAWASSLVPKNQAFDVTISGFDLETYVRSVLAAADFTKPDALPKDVADKLAAALLPTGAAKVELTDTGVSNDTYDLSITGSMTAGPVAVPSGKAHVTFKGFDEVMKAVNGAPPQANLKGASAVFVLAKGLAKTDSDGNLAWDVEASSDGKVLVNGTDVKQLGK